MKIRPINLLSGCGLIVSVGVLLPAMWPCGINFVGLLFAIVGIAAETAAIVFAFPRYGAWAAAGAAALINVAVYALWMASVFLTARLAAKRPTV